MLAQGAHAPMVLLLNPGGPGTAGGFQQGPEPWPWGPGAAGRAQDTAGGCSHEARGSGQAAGACRDGSRGEHLLCSPPLQFLLHLRPSPRGAAGFLARQGGGTHFPRATALHLVLSALSLHSETHPLSVICTPMSRFSGHLSPCFLCCSCPVIPTSLPCDHWARAARISSGVETTPLEALRAPSRGTGCLGLIFNLNETCIEV